MDTLLWGFVTTSSGAISPSRRLIMEANPSPSPQSCCVQAALQRIWALDLTRTPPSQDYPPIASIPRTPSSRLDRAAPKPLPEEPIPASSPLATHDLSDSSRSPTVLYLAYGSNLSAETFLGQRGIRPITAINVSAPSLRLTFDLPGIAYKEPCFANTAPRKIPKPPKLPPGLPNPPGNLPNPPEIPPGFSFPPPTTTTIPPAATSVQDTVHHKTTEDVTENAHGDPVWDKGLIGVVYEVTPEDYATIVKTEGGGASYKDILVPCIPIPTTPPGIPEKPPVPELPRPFLAHTLYAPRIPQKPRDGNEEDSDMVDGRGDGDDDDGDDRSPLDRLKDRWRKLLLQPIRPDPDYAQPSARYLKLITDGAAEHNLPVEYQRWLASLQPYTITTRCQAMGQYLFLGLVMPIMLLYFALGKVLANDKGQVPVWFGLVMETLFHIVWRVYDRWFKPVFGDGERTVANEDGRESGRMLWRSGLSSDEEKARLLDR